MRTDPKDGIQAGGAPTARLAAVAFALFTFLLMGTGTWSDLALMGQDLALPVYYLRELMLAAGFVLCGLALRGEASRSWARTHAVGICTVLGMGILACVGLMALPVPRFTVTSSPGCSARHRSSAASVKP